MKRKYLFISIRNLLITIAVIAVVLTACELFLANKNRKDEKYYEVASENQNILLMQVERTPVEKLFMSATNVYNSRYMFENSSIVPELKEGYPLIDDMTKETELEDAFNIVVIGDSFVWGAYSLNRNELFWRVLENELRDEGIRANVYGVAATGANAYEELSWLTETALIQDLNPDLVIFGYVYNDSDDSVDISESSVNWSEELPILSKAGKIFPNLYARLTEKISTETMYSEKYSNSNYVNLDGAPPVLKGRFYEKYKADFVEKLDSFAENVDFPIAVMTLPTLPENAMLSALYEPLEELYKPCENISFYDCLDEFNRFASPEHSNNYSVNIADFHPGSATHKFYADYIKEFIKADFSHLIKESCCNYQKDGKVQINEYLPFDISLEKIGSDETGVHYSFEYPSETKAHSFYGIEIPDYYLTEPLGEPHVKLSFSDYIDISEVKIQGQYDSLKLYYTCINESLGYDDHSIYEFTSDAHGIYSGSQGKKITSVLVSARFNDSQERHLTVSFEKTKGGSEQ